MAKTIERLKPLKIQNGSYIPTGGGPAYHPDGHGLYLRATPGGTQAFHYRWFHAGKQHWLQRVTTPR
jgi:hypothetical protein